MFTEKPLNDQSRPGSDLPLKYVLKPLVWICDNVDILSTFTNKRVLIS